ncbi:MAG: ubiquinol-cytochrome c reductase iron-sulfur subunit [Gemmatimonadales bacterium]
MNAGETRPGGNSVAARDGCGDCPIGRREFLRAGTVLAAAAVAVVSLPGLAAALPVRFASALGRSGKDVRYAIPVGDSATIDKTNDVIIARVAGAMFALDLTCPHQNTAIRWSARENIFECPKHHSKYSPSGIFLEGRATRSLDRFPIRREGDQIIVDVDTTYREDHDRAQWEAAVVKI